MLIWEHFKNQQSFVPLFNNLFQQFLCSIIYFSNSFVQKSSIAESYWLIIRSQIKSTKTISVGLICRSQIKSGMTCQRENISTVIPGLTRDILEFCFRCFGLCLPRDLPELYPQPFSKFNVEKNNELRNRTKEQRIVDLRTVQKSAILCSFVQ